MLFQNHSSVAFWRVDFIVNKNQKLNGLSSVKLLVNQQPKNGNCTVDKYSGISLSTTFNIKCLNWIDPDGTIERYEFMGKIINYLIKKNFFLINSIII